MYDDYEYSEDINKLLNDYFEECRDKKNKKIIEKLNSAIAKYPKVPQFKNYLCVAFQAKGEFAKAIEINDWIIKEHPDYLFAKLNKANDYINLEQAHKVPEVFGNIFDIKELYPHRDIFHLDEVTGFYRIIVKYFAKIEDLENAEKYLAILNEIDPEDPDTEDAESYLFYLRMQKAQERMEERNKLRIKPVNVKILAVTNKTETPLFNHSEINELYNYGLNIQHEILNEIIALPRTTLIEDLEKLLTDAVERYDYFVKEGWSDENSNFVIHSIFLIAELNSVESLPKILSFIEFEYEFLEHWLGDFRTEFLWQCIYKLGLNQIDVLKEFLLKPGIDTFSKSAVTDALNQMVLHHTEKREEILLMFTEVFTGFLNAKEESNLLDTDFLGFAISDLIDCNLYELLPIIKLLFEKGYVSLDVSGDYYDVEEEFKNLKKRNYLKKIKSIFEIYDGVNKSWHIDKDDDYTDYKPIVQQQAVSEKIGRNEPCPCGSGKKYKKCCMNK